MKFVKILSIAALATLAFACNKQDYPEYTKGPEDTANKAEVFFVATSASEELEPTAETYEIAVGRASASGALSVPVKAFDPSGVFDVPANIEFADGADKTTLVVGITKMELETPYELTLSIPADNYYFYKDSENSVKNTFHLSALKQKWNDAGTCTFYDGTFFDPVASVENVKIQNHEGTDDYRIIAPYNALSPDDFGASNIVFSIVKNVVTFKDAIYDIWTGTGYYMYWNTSSYSSYCFTKNSKMGDAVLVEVSSLVTDGASLYTGGYFAFAWTGSPIEVK